MITEEVRVQMRRLVLAEHWRIETVARRFGVHHSVVRRAIRDGVPAAGPRASRLEAFKLETTPKKRARATPESAARHAAKTARSASIGVIATAFNAADFPRQFEGVSSWA